MQAVKDNKNADEQREQPQIVEEDNKELKVQVASRAELASLTAQVKLLTADVETQRLENSVLQKEVQLLKDHPMSVNFIRDCDKRTKFFTGLTTFFLFTTVFEFVAPQVHRLGKLTLMDEFLMVIMKLRLSLLNEDLSYKFGVSVSAVSRIFHKWLEVVYIRLKPCIRWPDKETVQKTLPTAFKKYSEVCCIIDCSEIFIERPTSLQARAKTFSITRNTTLSSF